MPCIFGKWTNYTTSPVSYGISDVCWDSGDDEDSEDTYRPESGEGSPSKPSSSGVSTGTGPDSQNVNFGRDPTSPTGTVVVGAPSGPAPDQSTVRNEVDMNFGWNSGAHSIEALPGDWMGRIVFDIPDVQGARPGGVAIGLAPVSALPTAGRSGYSHLKYGLVFTADEVRVISSGVQVDTVPYEDVRAARSGGATDKVEWLMYGDRASLRVNGLYLDAGPFSMPGDYALDATLYTAFDAVDNPAFIEGEWTKDTLFGSLSPFIMDAGSPAYGELAASLSPLDARLSQIAQADLVGSLPALAMTSGGIDEAGLVGALKPLQMLAYAGSSYGEVRGSLQLLQMTGGMEEKDKLKYAVLGASLPRLSMTATSPPVASIHAAMPVLYMRASAETTYSEMIAGLPALRTNAYGAGMTPLVRVLEIVGCGAALVQSTYVSVAIIERVDGTSTAILSLTMAANATEEISAGSELSALQTYLASTFEHIGTLERVRVATLRDAGGGTGAVVVDDSEAWTVNTATSATTRYDCYGFNSFAAFGGKHYGAKPNGVYLLEGATDAGQAITSGVSLGQHDFGTQALKHISAVYVGASSTGELFLKVGDGTNSYTYRARRVDPHMKVQRFDLGRGLRTNFFTFDLTNESDAFELDSVQFAVLASQRRI